MAAAKAIIVDAATVAVIVGAGGTFRLKEEHKRT